MRGAQSGFEKTMYNKKHIQLPCKSLNRKAPGKVWHSKTVHNNGYIQDAQNKNNYFMFAAVKLSDSITEDKKEKKRAV